jgi:IS605 OrfB family transposase
MYTELAKISKNVYNSTIYCIQIFNYFKLSLYKELYQELKNNSKIDIDKFINHKLINYYDLYSKISSYIKSNNNYIYKFIINEIKLCKTIIKNSNYLKYIDLFTFTLNKNKNIYLDGINNNLLFNNIIKQIITSMCKRNYCIIKSEMLEHKPYSFYDNEIINDIKNNKIIDFNIKNPYKTLILSEFNIKLKSDKNYVGRLLYVKLGNNHGKIDSTMIGSIIDKAFSAYNSYYRLLNKGFKSSQPKYLEKNTLYTLIYSYSKTIKVSRKIKNKFNIDKEKNKILLFTSNYMKTNFSSVIDNNFIQLTKNKYIDKRFLKVIGKNKKLKKDNYIYGDKYIEKKCDKIIDSRYIEINLPKIILNKEIKMIEIIFQNNIPKICFTYISNINNNNIDIKLDSDSAISIDLGMKNLMTIYNPTGKQKIISGKFVSSINSYFNKKISHAQSSNNYNKVNKLNYKRTNIINNYFNNIIKWMENEYSEKKQIIIGYNKEWKKGCNMGSNTNGKFYGIPYCKIINKIKNKFLYKNIKVNIIEESYTSKCDSLSLEKICKHETYIGNRLKRGLFSSGKGKLLNADINGAINIMRKIYDLKEIKGINICNPLIVNIFHQDKVQ